MKRIWVTGLTVILDVSNSYDKKEIQERLDLINHDLSKIGNETNSGKIIGVNDIQDSDIKEQENIEDPE